MSSRLSPGEALSWSKKDDVGFINTITVSRGKVVPAEDMEKNNSEMEEG